MIETISGKTRICGLIGDPVEHTMSPAMHNAAFRKLSLDYIYLAFRVEPAGLKQAINGMRTLNMRGLNVTIPHKVNVIPFLDKVDPLAKKIGAVNTIVNDNGVLTGYNTDASGFLRAMRESGVEPKSKNVTVLGAGGASRAVSFILADNRANLAIFNRKEELDWAEELANRISRVFNREVRALELNRANLSSALDKTDILVNTTSVGMSPAIDQTPLDTDLLRSGLTVYDLVYNPVETKLLKKAAATGAKTIGGLNMLVWQGAIAFEKWTGQEAPVDLMRSEATKLL